MKHKRILFSLSILTTFVMLGSAASRMGKNARNLQVLPKDISDQKLDSIMQSYNKALGVNCNYCHVKVAGTDELDYVSDAKGEKKAARSMMLMTMEINKKYFGMERPVIGDSLMRISCKSCHKGEPYPSR